MDIASYFRCFEKSLSSYTGDDPLDPWDKFVEYLEQKLPADGGSGMSLVFDSLVQRFLNVKRYANDIRYVNHCIKCASYYSDPVALYTHIYSKGVGTQTAALYLAWAQQFEQSGMNDHAEAVYQRAMENQAQPAEVLLNEHRQFLARSRSQAPASRSRIPLQNSHLTNQMSSHREPAASSKASVDCPPRASSHKTTIIVSRSETSGTVPSAPGVHTVSEYLTDELLCDGSELCFEEVRAAKYFQVLQEQQATKRREMMDRWLEEVEEEILSFKSCLDVCGGSASQPVSAAPLRPRQEAGLHPDPTQHPFGPPSSSRRSLGLSEPDPVDAPSSAASHHAPVLADGSAPLQAAARASPSGEKPAVLMVQQALHGPDGLCQEDQDLDLDQDQDLDLDQDQDQDLDLGLVQPSSTQQEEGRAVELQEKLNMSQAGAANLSHVTPNTSLGFVQATPSRVLPSPTVNTREALDVIMDMFQAPTLLEDQFLSADPGFQRNGDVSSSTKPPAAASFTVFQDDKENAQAAAPPAASSKPIRALADIPLPNKPNDTPPDLMPDESAMWGARYNSLNSLAACPNSTSDFAMLAQFVSTPFTQKTAFTFYEDDQENGSEGDAAFRRQPKKLSPIMEQSPSNESVLGRLAPSSGGHGTIVGEGLAQHCLTSSSITMVQPPPPAALSFRDQTLCPTDAAAPGWQVFASPSAPSERPQREPLAVVRDPGRRPEPVQDVPMSPECVLKPDWLDARSPEIRAEPDLDAFLSPRDVPMSPQQPRFATEDEPMMSPDRGARTSGSAALRLVSDPWSEQLVAGLLSALSPPLTCHPRCVTWPCSVPNIAPKTTMSMGKASLRVDCVLGEGAFATVYQATDPVTSERMVLKVQKPANPWEFYINTQLDARLRPDRRHLFGSFSSAHLFHNGSVLLGELHSYGTLLNAVNLYKTQSDKVMPQPLAMYFTACVLHTVEQLHAVRLIHADIKPDNFLLGERFLESRSLDPESLDHGLVLIDLGQSIDMELFPEGTAFTAKCLTSGFQCTEMLSGKPWSYQTDYFGIAGTAHCLLFGTYMQVTEEDGVWRTNGVFRRNPHSDLWQDFFHTLLNAPRCDSPPSLSDLRRKLTETLQQNYGGRLASLKSRLMVLLLENRKAARR